MRSSLSVEQAIQAIDRPVFTTREIAALRSGSLSAATQALRRMERQRLVISPTRGVWCVPNDTRFTPMALVAYLAGSNQAYVSFFSALHLHGVIEQIPQVIYVATTGHTRARRTSIATYSFHRIHPRLFSGFDWYRQGQSFLIASPEKALVDCLYLSSRRGKHFRFFPELDLGGQFSFRRAANWVRRIPNRSIRQYVSTRLQALRRHPRSGTVASTRRRHVLEDSQKNTTKR